ncbi:MAG: FecR domain-containing protein [Proteobacteria bacterium]|nr:FecR domain-containing protein [Pseudomonadota bacterium]
MASAVMDSEAIERSAADWFARRESDSWTAADESRLDEWLAERTAHRIAFIRLQAAWQRAGRLRALSAGIAEGVIPPRGSLVDGPATATSTPIATPVRTATPAAGGELSQAPQGVITTPRQVTRPDRRRWIALAASLLLALASGVYVFQSGLLDSDRYATRVGTMESITLADGSRLTLNTDSRIHVEVEQQHRQIDLDRGEAFFEVASDPHRPFVVRAGRKRVVALGTKFSVRLDGDEVLVAVTEGKVRVEDESAPGADRATEVLLGPGSIARAARGQVLVHDGAGPEVDRLLSWRTGYLVFRNSTLAAAVAEFNRYNTRKIVIADAQIGSIRIGGNFRAGNTDAFLWLLQSGFPVSVDSSSERVVLKSR